MDEDLKVSIRRAAGSSHQPLQERSMTYEQQIKNEVIQLKTMAISLLATTNSDLAHELCEKVVSVCDEFMRDAKDADAITR